MHLFHYTSYTYTNNNNILETGLIVVMGQVHNNCLDTENRTTKKKKKLLTR